MTIGLPKLNRHPNRDGGSGGILSPAAWAVVLIAALSMIAMAVLPTPRPEERSFWLFARLHKELYDPIVAEWNASRSPRVGMTLLSIPAIERRMMSSFLSGLPSADFIEVERRTAARVFSGPPDSIGFMDLTERLASEGLLADINEPSFGPWSSGGRIYGLPHDVHPVLLAYRADLVEAAGIDVSTIETWDDFARVMRPLMSTGPGGSPRFLLNLSERSGDLIEVLILQAGGGYFDEAGRPVIASEVNARAIAQIVEWCYGPNRIAADAPDFSASGNKLKLDGYVVAALMPDWMCNIWKKEIPQLEGRVKLMPIPAWERGGRRTSVWGGTMLGIPVSAARTPEEFEQLWSFAKHLYLSRELARETYRTGDIITPVRKYWDDPVFDEGDPYFAGQRKARLFIEQAPFVPRRTSSPYNSMAAVRVQNAVVSLAAHARNTGDFGDGLRVEARRQLELADRDIRREMSRNAFATPVEGAP